MFLSSYQKPGIELSILWAFTVLLINNDLTDEHTDTLLERAWVIFCTPLKCMKAGA